MIPIFMLFLKFMSTKKGNNLGPTKTWCVGIKNPNVKQCTLSPAQEALCMDVSSSTITIPLAEDGLH